MKLTYAIVFTSDMERMTEFYRDGLGLKPVSESPFFTEFGTGATRFSLLAVTPEQKLEFELCFTTADLDAEIRRLRGRGVAFIDEIRQQPFGRIIHMRDPEETLVTLLEPTRAAVGGAGEPDLASALIHAWDFGGARMFYRDRLGLPVLAELPGWVEFGTGGTRLSVRARSGRPDAPGHSHQRVAYAFDVDDLDTWAREVDQRGVRLAAEPSDGETGLFAEAVDPDGNLVVFREPASVIPAPHAAAEAFEDDEAPGRAGFRKPVKKGSKAVSRVAIRPEYKTAGKPGARKSATRRTAAVDGKPKPKTKLKSVRGAGPDRTRLEPRKKNDPQRVTTKPAIGRLRKAERRTLASKKRAVATRSRSKPVKRAAANRSAKRASGRAR